MWHIQPQGRWIYSLPFYFNIGDNSQDNRSTSNYLNQSSRLGVIHCEVGRLYCCPLPSVGITRLSKPFNCTSSAAKLSLLFLAPRSSTPASTLASTLHFFYHAGLFTMPFCYSLVHATLPLWMFKRSCLSLQTLKTSLSWAIIGSKWI